MKMTVEYEKAVEVVAWNPPVNWVRDKILEAGTTIGSVHFNKRGGGELRKMSYRLHVTNPTVAAVPKSKMATKIEKVTKKVCSICGNYDCKIGPFKTITVDVPVAVKKVDKKEIDTRNNQITVLDANKVVRDKDGKVIGRGAWRTIPLENVVRIRNKGTTYIISHY